MAGNIIVKDPRILGGELLTAAENRFEAFVTLVARLPTLTAGV